MQLRRITLKGFRSIGDEMVINLGSLNALIGPNNAGKSNILSALYKVLGYSWVNVNAFDADDVYGRDSGTDIEIKIEFDSPIVYEPFKGIPVEVPAIRYLYTSYKRGLQKGQRRLEKECLKADGTPVFAPKNALKAGVRPQFVPLTTIPQEVQESIPVIMIGANRSLRDQLPGARNSLLGRLLSDVNDSLKSDSALLPPIEESGNRLELTRYELFKHRMSQVLELLRTKDLQELETSIRTNALKQLGFDLSQHEGDVDIYFSPLDSMDFYRTLTITVREGDFRLDATQLGGGFQNALVMAILKSFEERKRQGAIFLIEEPELYLHPQMQRSLYKTLQSLSETNQVIYVTHSAHFVTIPEFGNIRMVEKSQTGTHVTQSSLVSNPQLIEKFRKEMDPERSELFFATKVLFVEGDTEKLAVPEYATRKSVDIDASNTSIIEVSGKRNLKAFLELALSFKKKVGLIYDSDSPEFEGRRPEEAAYNASLDAYSANGAMVVRLDKNYEEEMRRELGEATYQELCQKYPNVTKAVRARLIAADSSVQVPRFLQGVIDWCR